MEKKLEKVYPSLVHVKYMASHQVYNKEWGSPNHFLVLIGVRVNCLITYFYMVGIHLK